MVKEGIKIFSRVKPTKKECGSFELGENSEGLETLSFHVPRSESSGYVNNKQEIYTFQFTHVFDQSATQEEVFELVAKGVIDNCLEGYNGTIFAYGQTGSGKTFTITGGTDKYSNRGIIPRSLSYLFGQYQKRAGQVFTTHVSYLEIYNERGYDLLDPRHEASKLEDLPKVSLMEDSSGCIHMKNLSMQQATNEEEALNWLFMGDTNRMIAETPMNMASTRSHCIFTVHFSSREPGSDVIRRSKLHLVDLAGSERIAKTGVSGTLLAEAKCINVSLHFLEQVIVALSEPSRTHIPYRNSMMTSVLRDSLGGNCMTSMIATCAVEKRNIDESISTCRFSQRVALVKNEAIVNEELDPKLMVARLKLQVQELKEELSMATGEERTDELTEEEKQKCEVLVGAYVADTDPDARLQVGADIRKIHLCFQLLKRLIQQRPSTNSQSEERIATGGSSSGDSSEGVTSDGVNFESVRVEKPSYTDNKELQQLQELLKQRDNEINILVKMLKQEKSRAAAAEASLQGGTAVGASSDSHLPVASVKQQKPTTAEVDILHHHRSHDASSTSDQLTERQQPTHRLSQKELSKAKQEAFDTFKRDYKNNITIEGHKNTLRARYADAKELGERINHSRTRINELKSQIERHRLKSGSQNTSESPSLSDDKEDQLKRDIENEKANFKELYGQLKDMKTEIEHVQHLLEKAKVQMQKDFETWWKQQSDKMSSKSAWGTPTPPHSGGRPPTSSKHHKNIVAKFPDQQQQQQTNFTSSDRPVSSSSSTRSMVASFPGQHRHLPDSAKSLTDDGYVVPSTASISSFPSITTSSNSSVKLGNTDSVHNQLRAASLASKSSASKIGKSNDNSSSVSAIPLTGDSKADADIIAFYKARQKLIKRKS